MQNQVRVLAKDHPGAADSLREGLHETLAVKKLDTREQFPIPEGEIFELLTALLKR